MAEDLRVATFAAPLSRDGPGLLLRDIQKVDDPQVVAVLAVMERVAPDVLVLTNFDFDYDQMALSAFADAAAFPYYFSIAPNTGMPTGLDLDSNGRLAEARDMQGYGRFSGDGGMAILSRYPIDVAGVRNLSDMLWRDLPGAVMPATMTADAAAVQRLSTTGHWIVPITTPDGTVEVMAFAHTTPVFDGPEDRNGLRNRDELRLWEQVLDGAFGGVASPFVFAGLTNLDPVDGDGFAQAMAAFARDPRLQDPQPQSLGAQIAGDVSHQGDPAQDTADWDDSGAGNLRVSYVLPSARWQVLDAGVFWPAPDDPEAALLGRDGLAAGPHHLVWVDIRR